VSEVAVVTDSTADFPEIHPAQLNVTVVPLTVNWGRDILRDGIDITTEEFYLRLQTDRAVPHTAAPPIGIFEEVYRNLLQEHDAVLSIHLASKLSGTYQVAAAAARSVDPERIRVIDSTSVSVGEGWLVQCAAELAEQGANIEQASRLVEEMIPRLRLILTLESLEYLHRGGRIGRAQAFLGGLLNVKPVLEVRDGEVRPLERVRTRAGAVRRVLEITRAFGKKQRSCVVHGACEDEATALSQQVAAAEGRDQVPIIEIGAVIGTHAGPGVLGIASLLAS
jgi:DegV family protein with EDD domain